MILPTSSVVGLGGEQLGWWGRGGALKPVKNYFYVAFSPELIWWLQPRHLGPFRGLPQKLECQMGVKVPSRKTPVTWVYYWSGLEGKGERCLPPSLVFGENGSQTLCACSVRRLAS